MKCKIFLKIWLPLVMISCIVGIIPILIEGDQTYISIIANIIILTLIGIQLLDLKYKFKILN